MSEPTLETPVLTPETLADADKAVLEVAKLNRKLAIANAETAIAKNEASDLSFRNIVLQLYLKYNLDPARDAIAENGEIQRNALLKKADK
jgi:hypothetical protein